MLAAGMVLSHKPWSWAIASAGLVARVLLQFLRGEKRSFRTAAVELVLLPLRDSLSLVAWAAAYCGSRVRWREHIFDELAGRIAVTGRVGDS
jgi:hypothetical protein